MKIFNLKTIQLTVVNEFYNGRTDYSGNIIRYIADSYAYEEGKKIE